MCITPNPGYLFVQKGFSLIEILMVLVITAILSTIAYPSYQTYILRVHRHDGQAALLDLANRMEYYYSEHGGYQSASITDMVSTNKSLGGWYQLSIIQASETDFTLQAIAIGQQALADERCASLTINSQGLRNGSSEDCWN